MRATSVVRFAGLGAIGFGIGVVVAGAGFLIPVGGAIGGAALGLALEDRSKAVSLALLGALGATLGVILTFVGGSAVWDSPATMAVVIGAVIGASLGLAFLDLKRIVALAMAGGVGFGLGGTIAGDSPYSLLAMGIIGGALLGATLGYLEQRRLAEGRGPRVR